MGISPGFGNIINEGNIYGTYIHGIFDRSDISSEVIKSLMKSKGVEISHEDVIDMDKYKEKQYEILAENLEKAIDVDELLAILGGK